jgi:hypothetical protein
VYKGAIPTNLSKPTIFANSTGIMWLLRTTCVSVTYRA